MKRWFVVAVVIGVLLRFYGLDDKVLWHDEVATRIFAAGYRPDEWKGALYTGEIVPVSALLHYQEPRPDRSLWNAVVGLVQHDPQHPPLYYVLAALWVDVFGPDIGVLRALSAVFGLLCLPAAAWLGRELYGNGRVPAALVALSPFFVLYAQEAREYALWSALILASTAALLRAARVGTLGAWVAYGVLLDLGLYTSFSTSSAILAHIVWVVVTQRGRFTRVSVSAAATMAVSALVFAPWAWALIQHYDAFTASMAWSKEIVIPRLSLLRIFGFNLSRLVLDLWPELERPWQFVASFAVVGLAGVALVNLRRMERASAWMIALLIVTPMAMLLAPDLVSGGIRSVSTRYLTCTWVGVLAALAFYLKDRPRLLFGVAAVALVSDVSNARLESVWTKGTSIHLPEVSARLNAEDRPLLVGNIERSNPGNLMALAVRLDPDVSLQLVPIEVEERWAPPDGFGAIYLFGPIPPYREAMEARAGVETEKVYSDLYFELWRVHR